MPPPARPAPPPARPDPLGQIVPRAVAEWARLAARRPTRASGEREEDEAPPAPSLAYLDAFARAGVPRGGAGPRERASAAVVALRSAAEEARCEWSAVLLDADPGNVDGLRHSLARAGVPHVRVAEAPVPPRPGEALVAEADFRDAGDEVLSGFDEEARVLAVVVPPAAARLPWMALRPLLRLPGVDLLLAFPHGDLHRLAAFASTPYADLPPPQRRHADGYGALFGDAKHEWLAEWRRAEREDGAAAAEEAMARRWEARVRAAAPERVVRRLHVVPADASADAAPLHLLLVTDEPALSLALNAVLRETGFADRAAEAGARLPEPDPDPEAGAVLDLFGVVAEPEAAPPAGVDLSALAERIAGSFRGRAVPFRDVLLALAASDAVPDEVRRALAILRKGGRAVYRSLADDGAEVRFPETAVPPAPRRRRSAADGEPGLFADPAPYPSPGVGEG